MFEDFLLFIGLLCFVTNDIQADSVLPKFLKTYLCWETSFPRVGKLFCGFVFVFFFFFEIKISPFLFRMRLATLEDLN